MKLFDAIYRNSEGVESTLRYRCIDKSQVRRMFHLRGVKGERLIQVVNVKEQ